MISDRHLFTAHKRPWRIPMGTQLCIKDEVVDWTETDLYYLLIECEKLSISLFLSLSEVLLCRDMWFCFLLSVVIACSGWDRYGTFQHERADRLVGLRGSCLTTDWNCMVCGGFLCQHAINSGPNDYLLRSTSKKTTFSFSSVKRWQCPISSSGSVFTRLSISALVR